jgi:hypothetical protein
LPFLALSLLLLPALPATALAQWEMDIGSILEVDASRSEDHDGIIAT